ncbi:MAG: S8 family serine peptidase [Phycisphaerae bacterium]
MMNFFSRMRWALLIVPALCGSAVATARPLQIRWRSGAAQTIASEAAQNASKITELVPNRGTRHIVVQFADPIGTAQREKLAAAGVTLLHYLGDNAFFATVSSEGVAASELAEVTSLAGVAAVETPWKLHASLLPGSAPAWVIVGENSPGDPIIGAYVLFHPDVALRPKGVGVAEAYGAKVQDAIQSVNGLVIEIPLSQAAALAAEDIVEYIEPALPKMDALNAENRALTGADIAHTSPYNLDGSGVTVLVYDAGRAMRDDGLTHPDVAGRITLGDNAPASDHSSHVACTIGGDGSQSLNGVYRGMAPGVDLVSYGFQYDGTQIFLYTNPGDLEADYTQAITVHGADLANNSIGTNTCSNGFPCGITGDYGVTSALIDNIVSGNWSLGVPFRVLWANGNERQCTLTCQTEHINGYHSTAPPSCAKNHITVGAINANDDSMTTFSSWGPCDDGRLKPDISAPGCQIGGDNGVTSCNTALNLFGYSVKCGTSMATPTVTGLSALLLQDFRANFPTKTDFTNATLKALLAHNAVDIGNTGPDYQSGYGSVRIVPTIDFMRSGSFLEDQVSQGETFSILVVVDPGDPQLKVTLAWDDVAGTPLVTPALVNDLDLRVFDPGNVQFFPWTLDPANPALPAVQTQADHLNNIEQIVINAPAAGVYRVEVLGFNVPQGPQTFSLAGTPQLLLPNSGTLAPLSANIPTATQHTLTATFREGVAPFDPVPNTTVTFEVLSGPNVGILGTDLTDINGEATITYTGANVDGIDQIRASFDDAGTIRFSNTATATWAPGQLSLSPDGGTGNVRDDLTLTVTALQGAPPSNPIAGALVTFEAISGPNAGVLGTATTNGSGVASLTYTSADLAGTDSLRASFFDAGATRFSNTVTHTWVVGTITLSPTSATGTECTGHTLTADVVQGASPFAPMSGVTVTFDVISGPNVSLSGTGVTDAGGMATFTYPGDGGPGTDTIQASFIDGSATQLSNTATMTWSLSALDCNLNATPDECEIGWDQDCNANGAADLCDLAPVTNFGPTVALTADANPATIVTGELNGMPGLDIAIGNNLASTTSVLLNNGDGTFAAAVNYPIDGGASGIVMADFDGDGDQDLATATGRDTVSILMNNGDGTFAAEVVYPTNGDTPTAIATGDLDGINGPDLVVGNKKANANGDFVLTVMLNNGSGGFPTTTEEIVFDFPQGVAIGDMDGINGPDIVTAGKTLEFVKVLLNDGSAGFSPPLTSAPFAGNGPVWVTLGDYDGDTDLDAAFSLGDNTIHIMLNDGGGTLSGNNNFTTGVGPTTSVAKDLDNDGDLDLVVSNAGDAFTTETTFTVLINRSNGVFAIQPTVDTGTNNPIAIAAADFNLDGDADIALAHNLATGDVSLLAGNVTFVSLDCNANAIPDDCEPDADGDTVPDACDLCAGTFPGSPVDATGCPLSVTCSSAGTFVLDAATYTCSDTAAMQVIDCDLNLSMIAVDTVDVTLASTTEPAGETVTLTETAIDSAVFEGSIPLSTTDGVGIVQIGSGDLITATYVDANDGLGGINVTVTDTATIPGDCLDVTVELEAVDTAITRTVTFVVTDCTGPVTETFTTAINFDAGIPMVRGGQGSTTLTLSTPGATWISADEGHTLRTLLSLGAPLPTSVAFAGADRLIAGDFSGDGLCDIEDLSVLASNFMTPGDAADATGNGVQETADFTAILVNFFLVSDAVDGCP